MGEGGSRVYHVFISHSWAHSDEYVRLVELLDSVEGFCWKNYSSPAWKPVLGEGAEARNRASLDALLEEELVRQMTPVSCVVVLAGLYVVHSRWIKREMEIAASMSKPILAVRPWGRRRMPSVVKSLADEIVGWRASNVVDAIRRLSGRRGRKGCPGGEE